MPRKPLPRRFSKKYGAVVLTKKGRALARKAAAAKRKASNVPEYASLSCKRTLTTGSPPTNFNVNTMYSLLNTQLTDFQRAVQVAGAYQHYRIKKIAVTFKPTYDTFQAGSSKMNMYWMIDKAGAIPTNTNLEGLKQMGARPFTLDEKNHTIKWAPSVLESSMYTGGVNNATPSKYLISPWLSTTAVPIQPGAFVPSGIDHLGLYWFCEQLLTPTVTQYEVEVEVQFQFKKPLAANNTSSVSAIPARVADLNDSVDGIVGGVDGV